MNENPFTEVKARLEKGWAKHTFGTGTQKCLWGHLKDVENDPVDSFNVTENALLVGSVIIEQYPDRLSALAKLIDYMTIPGFNDHPDTTKAEVIAVVEKAEVRWNEQ